eukprot:10237996-Lingulodinium_polyedra.AAC.1
MVRRPHAHQLAAAAPSGSHEALPRVHRARARLRERRVGLEPRDHPARPGLRGDVPAALAAPAQVHRRAPGALLG